MAAFPIDVRLPPKADMDSRRYSSGMSGGCRQRAAGLSLAARLSLRVRVEINADVSPMLPNHVRAIGQRIGSKCPIALPKMSAIENTIPNTIPVSTVFIGKLLASSGTSPFRTMSKMRRWCCVIGHRGDLPRIHGAQCSMRKLKLLVLMYRARLAVALCFQRLQK